VCSSMSHNHIKVSQYSARSSVVGDGVCTCVLLRLSHFAVRLVRSLSSFRTNLPSRNPTGATNLTPLTTQRASRYSHSFLRALSSLHNDTVSEAVAYLT
jgi:hypothetical protein